MSSAAQREITQSDNSVDLAQLNRAIVVATQEGLPLVPQPYHALAEQIGVEPELIQQRLQQMLATGVIRRIAAVPNHYQLGFRCNGMSVWDVDDNAINELGQHVGELDFVSHAYQRPRYIPLWPYNLFAMVHGQTREEVSEKVDSIAEILGDSCKQHDVLVSTRILKKTGLRISKPEHKQSTAMERV